MHSILTSSTMPCALRLWIGMQWHAHTSTRHNNNVAPHTNSALTCLLLHWSHYTFSIICCFFWWRNLCNGRKNKIRVIIIRQLRRTPFAPFTRAHFGCEMTIIITIYVDIYYYFSIWFGQTKRVYTRTDSICAVNILHRSYGSHQKMPRNSNVIY